MHPLEDPQGPLKTQYNPLKSLLGPPDFGLQDLWLSASYHPRWEGPTMFPEPSGLPSLDVETILKINAVNMTGPLSHRRVCH